MPGVKAPKDAGAPRASESVAGTAPPTVPFWLRARQASCDFLASSAPCRPTALRGPRMPISTSEKFVNMPSTPAASAAFMLAAVLIVYGCTSRQLAWAVFTHAALIDEPNDGPRPTA